MIIIESRCNGYDHENNAEYNMVYNTKLGNNKPNLVMELRVNLLDKSVNNAETRRVRCNLTSANEDSHAKMEKK